MKYLNGNDILNYRLLYDLFLKHSNIYYDNEKSGNLEEIFSKTNGISLEEEIEQKEKNIIKYNLKIKN